MKSANGKLILEPYMGGKGVKSEVKSGFATVKRSSLVGLKLLADALIVQGQGVITLSKGSTVFISEEHLTVHQNYHNVMENALIGVPFVIGDFNHVVMAEEG